MSVHVESWAWKQKMAPTRKLILVKLASMSNDDGVVYEPLSQEQMAVECGVSRQTMTQHIAAMRGEGIVQMIEHRDSGGRRLPSTYQVMVPWAAYVGNPDVGISESAANSHVGNPDIGKPPSPDGSPSSPPTPPLITSPSTPSLENLADAGASAPAEGLVRIDRNRWRVPSSSSRSRGPFLVDLAAMTCSCENRSSTECKHIRAASAERAREDIAARREARDALWDTLVGIFGEPAAKRKSARGSMVTALAEHLHHAGVGRDGMAAEVGRRYAALVADWGLGKVTEHSFTNNFDLAGKLADGAGAGRSGPAEDDEYAVLYGAADLRKGAAASG